MAIFILTVEDGNEALGQIKVTSKCEPPITTQGGGTKAQKIGLNCALSAVLFVLGHHRHLAEDLTAYLDEFGIG